MLLCSKTFDDVNKLAHVENNWEKFCDYALRAAVLLKDLKTVTGRSISRWSSFFKPQSYCFTSEQERGGDALFPRLTQTGDSFYNLTYQTQSDIV